MNLHGIRYGRRFLAFHAESCNLENTTINILLQTKKCSNEIRTHTLTRIYISRCFVCWNIKPVIGK